MSLHRDRWRRNVCIALAGAVICSSAYTGAAAAHAAAPASEEVEWIEPVDARDPTLRILVGSQYRFARPATAAGEQGPPQEAVWSLIAASPVEPTVGEPASEPIRLPEPGKIDAKSGFFVAGNEPARASATLLDAEGEALYAVPLQVVDALAGFELRAEPARVLPGEYIQLSVKGYDSEGREVVVSPSSFAWSVYGSVGWLDPTSGLLLAGPYHTRGEVVVRFGDLERRVEITVGQPPSERAGRSAEKKAWEAVVGWEPAVPLSLLPTSVQ